MPPAVPWYVEFAQLLYATPVLVVSVFGLGFALRRASRHPVRSRLAACGFGLIFVSRLATTIAVELMAQLVDDQNWAPLAYQKASVLVSVLNGVFLAVGLGLLATAVFRQEEVPICPDYDE